MADKKKELQEIDEELARLDAKIAELDNIILDEPDDEDEGADMQDILNQVKKAQDKKPKSTPTNSASQESDVDDFVDDIFKDEEESSDEDEESSETKNKNNDEEKSEEQKDDEEQSDEKKSEDKKKDEDEEDDYEPEQKKKDNKKEDSKEKSDLDASDDVDSNTDAPNKSEGDKAKADKPEAKDSGKDLTKPDKQPSGRFGDTPPGQSGKVAEKAGEEATKKAGEEATKQATKTAVTNTATTATTTAGAGAAAGGSAAGGAVAIGAVGWWVVLIILVIVLLVIIISTVLAWIEGKTSADALQSNPYITNEHFYGLRTAYIDDEPLSNALQLSYKQYVVDVLERIDDDGTITLNISLPADGFDNSTEVDTHITNMSLAIGNIIATGSSDYNIESFMETLYPNINYFGFTDQNKTDVTAFFKSYLGGVVTVNGGNLNTSIDTAVNTLTYMSNLCQKVMIKDEIAEENGLYDLESKKYVGSVYMANKDVTLSGLSYVINNQNADKTSTTKLISYENSSETILMEKEVQENGQDINVFDPAGNPKISLKAFTSIDSENISQFSDGISLFEAMKLIEKSGNQYFRQAEFTFDSETLTLYTWKPADETSLYLEFTSNFSFMYGEFNLKVE